MLTGLAEFPVYDLPERIGQFVTNTLRLHKNSLHVYLPKNASSDSVTEEFRNIMQGQLGALNGMIRYNAPYLSPSPSEVSVAVGAKKRSLEEMEWEDDNNLCVASTAYRIIVIDCRLSSVVNGAHERTDGTTPKRPKLANGSERARSPPSPALSTISLMSTSSAGGSRRGAKLRAMMDRMRAMLRGEEEL